LLDQHAGDVYRNTIDLSTILSASALALSRIAGGITGTINAGTLGQVTCYNANGTTVSGCPDITDRVTTNGKVFSAGLNTEIAETFTADATIGPAVPVKLDPACALPSGCVIPATNTDTSGIIGISADDESAIAGQPVRVVLSGNTGAVFDNTCLASQFVVNSPTVTGKVHCTGSPIATQVLGIINTPGGFALNGFLLLIGQVVQLPVAAFASLPACAAGTEGLTRSVSDSNTIVWGANIAGGGANHVLGYCDGTNWTVAAK
jgi:hypothetical protein